MYPTAGLDIQAAWAVAGSGSSAGLARPITANLLQSPGCTFSCWQHCGNAATAVGQLRRVRRQNPAQLVEAPSSRLADFTSDSQARLHSGTRAHLHDTGRTFRRFLCARVRANRIWRVCTNSCRCHATAAQSAYSPYCSRSGSPSRNRDCSLTHQRPHAESLLAEAVPIS